MSQGSACTVTSTSALKTRLWRSLWPWQEVGQQPPLLAQLKTDVATSEGHAAAPGSTDDARLLHLSRASVTTNSDVGSNSLSRQEPLAWAARNPLSLDRHARMTLPPRMYSSLAMASPHPAFPPVTMQVCRGGEAPQVMVDCLDLVGPTLLASFAFQGIHLAREVCIWQPAGGPAIFLPDDVRTVLQELESTNDLTPSIFPEILQP